MPITLQATALNPEALYQPSGLNTNPTYWPQVEHGQLTVLTLDIKTLMARAGVTSLAAGSYLIAKLPVCKILPQSYITTSGVASLTASLALNDYIDDNGVLITNNSTTQILTTASLASAGTQAFSALTSGTAPTAGGGFQLRPQETADLILTTAGAAIVSAANVEIVLFLVTRR